MESGNIFASIPDIQVEELVEILAQNENVKIERIISKGQISPTSGWYDQDNEEWVIVLKGEAIIVFTNGNEMNLIEGSYINIPAHTKHKVAWTDPNNETVWLAIHY